MFEAIIVGSGYGGLLPAWRLTQEGAKVLLIERGGKEDPKQFRHSWDPLYLKDFYDFGFSTNLMNTYRASRILGGGSVMNSMMHQRVPSDAFDFCEEDLAGRRAWPSEANRAALERHYEKVEELLGIHQLSWNEVPQIGGNFARMFNDAGLSADPARMNIGSGCVHCGFCEAGCRFENAKLTLAGRALREALATGNLTVREQLTAKTIRSKDGDYEVDCVTTGKSFQGGAIDETFRAKRLIVAAGPLGTIPLLKRSAANLSRLSPSLGQRMNNNGDVNFLFVIPEHYPDHEGYKSTNNAGVITYAFWKQHRVTMHPGFSPVAVLAGIDARLDGALPWGLEHKYFVKTHAIHRMIPVNAMRQIAPDLSMDIDDQGQSRIRVLSEEKSTRHGEFMFGLAKSVADRVGGRVMKTGIGKSPLDQGGNHILGGARMSDDPQWGVTDPFGEVWGHPGLYVTDATNLPSTIGINPALTIGANALRIADHLARNFQ